MPRVWMIGTLTTGQEVDEDELPICIAIIKQMNKFLSAAERLSLNALNDSSSDALSRISETVQHFKDRADSLMQAASVAKLKACIL